MHGFAVELYLDAASEERLVGLWRALARDGITSLMLDIGARPHISLAVFSELEVDALRAPLEAFARAAAPLTLTLSHVGVFPAANVVFAAPAASTPLLQLHAKFHALLRERGLPSYHFYLPGAWVPHCTLAMELPPERVGDAVAACLAHPVFGPATATHLALVEFRPVVELAVLPLGDGTA